ncbi:fungal-specific transcription factor domain-containing protein [Leptodontidium sp. 2 PMI_412]|nr:fungal-specific transcription factor domain-containing protein [Leptodontidium sp. 2 PMI_412]
MSNPQIEPESSIHNPASDQPSAHRPKDPGVVESAGGERPAKRRKTRLACDECRLKKIKCDGVRPVCAACSTKGPLNAAKCSYEKENNVPAKQQIADLRNKIRDLENTQQAFRTLPLPAGIASDPVTAIPTHASSSAVDHSIATAPLHAKDPTYGVSAIVGAVTGEAQNEGFHGLSSAATFMQQIRQQVDLRAGFASPNSNQSTSLPDEVSHERQSRRNLRSQGFSCGYTLPPRRTADYLINTYWTYVFPLYPFLHRSSFTEAYKDVWDGGSISIPDSMSSASSSATDEATFLCTFNLVLALSCQYAEIIEPDQCQTTANMFFQRAKDLLKFDPVESTGRSVQLVQALLLMGQYLQGIGSANRAWSVIGIALRICHELGLHNPSNKAERSCRNITERELVRRLYHGCLMLERMLCMNLGRPIMTPAFALEKSMPLPIESDDDTLEIKYRSLGPPWNQATTQSLSEPCVMTFFLLSARLYRLVQHILVSLYLSEDTGGVRDYSDLFTGPDSVLALDHHLMQWYDTVPRHLRLDHLVPESDQNEELSWTFRRQAVVLRVRFLHARIYLLRPVLSMFCTKNQQNHGSDDDQTGNRNIQHGTSSNDMLNDRAAAQCSILCVNIAMELISVVHENLTTKAAWGQRPSWLFGVLHIYLSATVLIAARLQPSIISEASKTAIETAWQHALEILRTCQTDNQSAARCVAALEIMYRKLNNKEPIDLPAKPDHFGFAQGAVVQASGHTDQYQLWAPDMMQDSSFVFDGGEIDYFGFLTDPTWVTDFQPNM